MKFFVYKGSGGLFHNLSGLSIATNLAIHYINHRHGHTLCFWRQF